MLELMARGGMRIGEVLKIRAGDVEDQKIILHDPELFLLPKPFFGLKEFQRRLHLEFLHGVPEFGR